MSRDKQIEEMVKAVCIRMRDYPKLTCKKCKADNSSTNAYCRVQFEMERLYNAGYRKSQDVAEEIFAEIDDFQRTLRHIFLDMCGGNDYNTLNLLQIDSAIEALFNSRIAELKKKYTQESEVRYDRRKKTSNRSSWQNTQLLRRN